MKPKTWLLWMILIMAVGNCAYAGIIRVIEGTVTQVNLDDPKNPEITIIKTDADGKPVIQVLKVHFSTTPEGCIDWKSPENLKMALALGLQPGNVIQAFFQIGKEPVNPIRLSLVAVSSDTYFDGFMKIKDSNLIRSFRAEPIKVPVMILLAGHQTLKAQMADSDPNIQDQAKANIKRMQDSVIQTVGKDSFDIGFCMENIPILTGKVTLDGLKSLAAHPDVEAIELDKEMELMPRDTDSSSKPNEPADIKPESVSKPQDDTKGTVKP